jgi:hypothetical protein
MVVDSQSAGDGEIAASFIGSFRDDSDLAVIVLRGKISADVVERLGVHIGDCLAAGTRSLTIDAAAVESYGTPLLDLLGRTQARCGQRCGILQARGLHPLKLQQGPPYEHDSMPDIPVTRRVAEPAHDDTTVSDLPDLQQGPHFLGAVVPAQVSESMSPFPSGLDGGSAARAETCAVRQIRGPS